MRGCAVVAEGALTEADEEGTEEEEEEEEEAEDEEGVADRTDDHDEADEDDCLTKETEACAEEEEEEEAEDEEEGRAGVCALYSEVGTSCQIIFPSTLAFRCTRAKYRGGIYPSALPSDKSTLLEEI